MKLKTSLLVGLAGLCGSWALATESPVPVWRCGNMYTNQPLPDQSCESVTLQTREETQVPQPARRAAPASAATSPAGKPASVRVDASAQRERDGQAKHILSDELKRLTQRCQGVSQAAEVQRCAADQAALKRELSRLP